MKTIFSHEQNEYMKSNYDKMTYKEIGEKLGFTERQIRGRINNMGLSKLRRFNKDYFEKIDSPNQAYWLGFIYADGYIIQNRTNRNYELGIDLQEEDGYLLEEFNRELGGVHCIKYKHKNKSFNGYEYTSHSAILRIYCKKLTDDLISRNVHINKTYRKEFPQCREFFWDFLRGFIDGDGCLHINQHNRLFLQITNANTGFLEYLVNEISDRINITGSIYKEKDLKYRLVFFWQSDVRLLLDEIYRDENCVKLERKHNIYKSYYRLSPLEIAG